MRQFATIQGRKVFVSKNSPFALYESSGENSHKKGTIFPFFGISLVEPFGKFIKPNDIFEVAYINLAWLNLSDLIIEIENTFSADSLYIEAHELMMRWGTPHLMCLSAAIGGGVWESDKGEKLRAILETTFDMTNFIRDNEWVIKEVQEGFSTESFEKNNPIFMPHKLKTLAPGEQTNDLESHFAEREAIKSMAKWITNYNAQLSNLNALSMRPSSSLHSLTKNFLCSENMSFLMRYCKVSSVKQLFSPPNGKTADEQLSNVVELTHSRCINYETLYLAPEMSDEQRVSLGSKIAFDTFGIVLFDDNKVCVYSKGQLCFRNHENVGITVPHRANVRLSGFPSAANQMVRYSQSFIPPHSLDDQTMFLRVLAKTAPRYVINCAYSESTYRIMCHQYEHEWMLAGMYFDPKKQVLFSKNLVNRPKFIETLFAGVDVSELKFRQSILSSEEDAFVFFHKLSQLMSAPLQPNQLIHLLHVMFEQDFLAMGPHFKPFFKKHRFFQSNDLGEEALPLRNFCEENQKEQSLRFVENIRIAFEDFLEQQKNRDQVRELANFFCSKTWPLLEDFLQQNTKTNEWYLSLDRANQANFKAIWESSIPLKEITHYSQFECEQLELMRKKLPLLMTIIQNNLDSFKQYSALSCFQESRKTNVSPFSKMDAYQVLGLQANTDLPRIKRAYYQKCLSCHPDKTIHRSVKEREVLNDQFKHLTEAYQFLLRENEHSLSPPSMTV